METQAVMSAPGAAEEFDMPALQAAADYLFGPPIESQCDGDGGCPKGCGCQWYCGSTSCGCTFTHVCPPH
jgi:hypothetical protein